jgi:hypothetical protein
MTVFLLVYGLILSRVTKFHFNIFPAKQNKTVLQEFIRTWKYFLTIFDIITITPIYPQKKLYQIFISNIALLFIYFL